jgi:hypothetical protein
MRVLLVTTDLMIASHVEGAAKRQAAALEIASYSGALQRLEQEEFDLVGVDLGTLSSELQPLRQVCPTTTTLLAFGPHVHKAKLDAAREAGFDVVLSRGEFHAKVDQLLQG